MELPPQVLKQEVRELAASQDLEALRSGAALETFGPRWPVLQAFQEFLEIERRQARRRLARLALLFLAMLMLIIAGGAAAILHMNGRMKRDVKALEDALASARSETSALRGNTEAMQSAIAAAQESLAAVRRQMEEGSRGAGPAPDLSALTSGLGLLQEAHRLRSDQMDLALRQAALQQDVERWEAEQRAALQLREKLLAQRQALQHDASDFLSRQEDLARRLQDLRSSAPLTRTEAGESAKRGSARGQGALAIATDPVAALALLQEIYRLRGEQPGLALRQSTIESGWNELELLQSGLAARREQIASSRVELAAAVDAFLARGQDLQARLASAR